MKNNETLQSEQPKEFNLYLAIGKVLLSGFAIFSILYTAQAAFMDTTLKSLEDAYKTASMNYDRAVKRKIDANNDERVAADNLCNIYKATKAYKELKKIPPESEVNPCVANKAPQEGF